jgi:hypothetical protein
VIAVRLGGMITILSALVSVLSFRFRSRASLELELVALRHQLIVLRRRRPRRRRLHSADRLPWVCLYRVWPRVLDALVLVKPATVVKWHRQGTKDVRVGAPRTILSSPSLGSRGFRFRVPPHHSVSSRKW